MEAQVEAISSISWLVTGIAVVKRLPYIVHNILASISIGMFGQTEALTNPR